LLIGQYYETRLLWTPKPWFARFWKYNTEALHFLYGGLMSIYVVLYARSAAGAKPIVFFLLLVGLMLFNEMPQIRRYGHRLRLGLYAFVIASFMIYFVPVMAGRMGPWVFALSLFMSGGIVWQIAALLTRREPSPNAARWRLFLPAGGALAAIAVLYVLRLIPPVPMSVQFDGLYHNIQKTNGDYELYYPKPPFYAFWKTDSRPFRAREGDAMHYFARIFAPRRFRHRVFIVWQVHNPAADEWVTTDRFPMRVVGGREEGFRAYAVKSKVWPGLWRVLTETSDGRLIGRLAFKVLKEDGIDERRWKTVRM
jgi:hypothetical protein